MPYHDGDHSPFGQSVLVAELNGNAWAGSAGDYWSDLFPPEAWYEQWFGERAFGLLYTGHGGSGLNLTLGDIEEMTLPEIEWWEDRLSAQREADAEAMKKRD